MAGDKIPYHLRPNKFVEREIFADLLKKISSWVDLSKSVYVSMGGAFLLDFRLLSRKVSFKEMVSLERNNYVFSRQKFNNTVANVNCTNVGTSTFVDRVDEWVKKYKADNIVVWFDYATPKRDEQIVEATRLVAKLTEGDVIKITLNISPRTFFVGFENDTRIKQKEIIYKSLEDEFGTFFPASEFSAPEMNTDGIARAMTKIVELSYASVLRSDPDYIMLPLSLVTYNDGFHDMLTISMIKIKDAERDSFLTKTKLSNWSYYSKDISDIKRVEVPELSIKERQHISALMVTHGDDAAIVHQNLGFTLDKGAASLKTLEAYIANQNYCPYVFLSRDSKLRKSIANYFESFL